MNISGIDQYCGSEFWNLNLTWYTDDPEFTYCFQQTVLVWIPAIFLWVFAPLELYYIKSSKNKDIPWSILSVLKLFFNLILIIISFMEVARAKKNDFSVSDVDIHTPTIKLMTFILSAVLTYQNRKHGLQSSGVLFIFWFLLSVCGVPQFREEVQHSQIDRLTYSGTLYFIYYSIVLFILFLHCFADRHPKYTKYPPVENPCPEDSSSFLSRILFFFFDPMAYEGFKRPLEQEDMWSMKREDSAGEVVPVFEKHWDRKICANEKSSAPNHRATFKNGSGRVDFTHSKTKKDASILPTLFMAFGSSFVFGIFLKLIQIFLVFVSPQLLGLLVGYLGGKEEQWKGYFYVGLIFAVATFQTIILSQFTNRMYLIGMRMRTALISVIYKKSLRISNMARKETSVGEIVNLMAVDAQNFVEIMPYVNIVWSAPLEICLSLYFIWAELGPSVLAGLAVLIILIPVNGFVANRVTKFQIQQMKNKDDRVKLINEVLSGIKVLKLYAWEPSFVNKVMDIRNREINVLKKMAYLNSINAFLWSCGPFLAQMVIFTIFAYSDNENVLTPEKLYKSLSLIGSMNVPLSQLPLVLVYCAETYVSVKRINKFLNSSELNPDNVSHNKSQAAPLVIENGTFTWGEDAILKNINLILLKGSLTAVVGGVGSGKSSLISAFLGEMEKTSGYVNTDGKIAYVSQQAWMQNATVRDNILFGKEFKPHFYDQVLEACALKHDFETLTAGDQTEIGEKGINLSGGQKQRISLARAVYADADIYFLDDPLSAVDSHVGKHIFDNVLGPRGLLKNKTRLLVTHGVTFLPETDKILVLKDGEVSESGSYKELLEKKTAFSEFLLQHMNESSEKEEVSDVPNELTKTEDSEKVVDEPEAEESKNNEGKGQLIEAEKTETGSVSWKVYRDYLKAIGFKFCLATVLLNLAFQVFSIGANVWLGIWADDKTVIVNGTMDPEKRDMYLGVYGALGAAQILAIIFCAFALFIGALNASRILHNLLLCNIVKVPMTTFFDITPLGRILNRFSKDIDVLDNSLPMILRIWCACFFGVVGTLTIITITMPLFATLIVPIGLVYYFIQRFYISTSRQVQRLESVSRSPIYSHFEESLSGAQAIRSYNQQDRFIVESQRKIDINQGCFYTTVIANRWLSVRLEMVGNFIILFASLFAILQKDSSTFGTLAGLSVAYCMQITQSLSFLVQMTSEIETNIVAVERIKEYGEAKTEAAWEKPDKQVPKNWPELGSISFKNYSVRYRPGLDLVLKNINMNIRGGEKIGIVGRTGAGKSSLTMALFRIIEADEGEIIIDGMNIADLGLHTLRSRLTIIPQDSVLFAGPLRMNLDPFEKHSDKEIWECLEYAHLKSYVESLPSGLQHEVAEGGENFSVGQRQLICLARAILRRTKIFIMDEATAAIDLETDNLIQKTIRNEFETCTLFIIAHRLNTILDSDRVVVLDKGQIAEFAPPQTLLANNKSIFYSMCKDAGLI